VVGQGATTHGSVRHHLGLLQAALGEERKARTHLEIAKSIHRRALAPLWVEHSKRALATL